MADANSTGGSPWDEPVPENLEPKKSQPTVIGDFGAGTQSAASAANQAAPASKPLNVPENVSEPVGAKVDAPLNTPEPALPAQPRSVPIATPEESAPPSPPAIDIKPAPAPLPTTSPVPDMSHLYQPVPTGRQAIPAAPLASEAKESAKPSQVSMRPMAQAPASGSSKPSGGKTKIIILAVIVGLIFLFASGIFLTESGVVSIGLEKVYGAIRLESLWGGLPANPENAFVKSAAKMKNEPNFKVTGTATLTVNKSVKSNIISPIVSSAALPILALGSDQPVSGIKALLAAVESDIGTDTILPESQSPDSASSSLATPGSTSIISNQEVTANISAKFGPDLSGATIDLKTSKNPSSQVELVYAKDKLYLKSSSNIVYDSKVKTGWISYDLAKSNIDAPSSAFWSSSFSGSDFSLTGSRVSDEKVGGVRCYHYSGKANIGGALSAFGLSENSVQSFDFDFWSGIADHRIYQMKMKIIPNVNSAISRIDLELNFSDYGSDTSSYSIPASSTPSSGSSAGQASTATPAARDTQRKSDLASIAKALDDYRLAYNTYPLATKNEKIAAGSGLLFENLVPTFISALPLDPEDPKYYYGYESDGTKYTLSAVLEVTTDPDGKSIGGKNIYSLKSQ